MGQGEGAKAVPILEEGIALAKTSGVIRHQVFGLNMLLISLLQLGEFQTSKGVAEEALDISRAHGLDFLRMMTLGSFTPIFSFQGKHEEAYAYTEEAIQLAKQFHNPWADAMSLLLKGHSERGKQNWVEAEADYSEASGLFEAVRDTAFMYISLSEAGHMKRRLGDYTGAEEIYRKTILFFRDGSGQSAVIHQLECFGMIAAFQNQISRAATLLGAAQAFRESEHSTRLPPEQIEFDHTLTYLAKELGATELGRIMAKEAQMSLDEAVELAIKETT
jgi:tetratricopeptide (TPR) repeat protein